MNPQFGSGSQLLGGTDALSEAMQRRGGALQQQSPASAGFNPMTGEAIPGMPQPQASPQMGQSQPQGLPQESNEAQIIIQALSKRLDNDSKMRMQQVKPF